MGQKHLIYFTLLETTAWKHVQHVPQGLKWHKATDKLMGTDVYGDPKVMTQPWSLDWSKLEYSEFLLSSGDCKHWAVIRKEDLIGEDGDKWYSNADVDIQVSSVSSTPYKAKMYRRKGHPEDPWVGIRNYGTARSIVYGAAQSVHNVDLLSSTGGK